MLSMFLLSMFLLLLLILLWMLIVVVIAVIVIVILVSIAVNNVVVISVVRVLVGVTRGPILDSSYVLNNIIEGVYSTNSWSVGNFYARKHNDTFFPGFIL